MKKNNKKVDIVLVGGGIMSATLGVLLKTIEPNITIQIFEYLDKVASESSDAWNNAGTGHAALCELNYTPENEKGEVEITKALGISESFEVSKQFWSYLVDKNIIQYPSSFINATPHSSFVRGAKNVKYLRKRHEAMTKHHFFEGMKYSEDFAQIASWTPLIVEGRKKKDKIAMSRIETGTDVDFGSLTRQLFAYLDNLEGVELHLNHKVIDLNKGTAKVDWTVEVEDLVNDEKREIEANFVFIGAGGGAILLLEKSGIEEGKGYGGFPVSGQWLRCTNQAIIEKHAAKVYGKAAVGSPPMSVPHLDTRIINGEKCLLFGPFAGFSTKFLKKGSYFDLPASIKYYNIIPMLQAGFHNLALTKYLLDQVNQTSEERLENLQEFVPKAKMEDWELAIAGQRVQVIKDDPEEGGVLEFGTEIVSAEDGSLAALLGASPGASTSVSIMLNLLKKCFPEKMQSPEWTAKIEGMIPSFGKSLAKDKELFLKTRAWTNEKLRL